MKQKFIFASFLLISACFGGVTKPSQFYMLQAISDEAVISRADLSVGVEQVHIPAYLDKPQIVLGKKGQVEMSVSELNRWAEALSSQIQRVLIADLSAYLPGSFIKPRISSRENFSDIIFVEINRFDGVFGEKAILEAWWSVRSQNGEMKYQKYAQFEEPLSDSYDDFVRVQSKLLSLFARDIALSLVH